MSRIDNPVLSCYNPENPDSDSVDKAYKIIGVDFEDIQRF
ncbi:hypothetical protein MTBBW1_290023 [Desulfamplus magnetovallimortis]|uniref:Uncharacterized protein n=1 Tax=Desulfamplus magnetovallimortis TaxID=1246637 RepID=A0A1W1HFT0_9BACT|nr:hypothetical protein MTBBW1_290023 [Desulfamplus magnetovallimortis]